MRKSLAVLAFALAACGGSDKAAGGGAAANTCNALLTIQAGLLERCAKVNPATYAPTGTFGARISWICDIIQAEVTAGRVRFDANQGAACLAAYRAVTCAELPPGDPSGEPAIEPAACTATFSGTVALNGTCFVGAGCSNGFCSSDYSLSCPGTCQPFQVAGGDCSRQKCGPGLACAYDSLTAQSLCKATGAAGAACPCQSGLWCNTANAGGRCETPIARGGACAIDSPGCTAGHQCQGATSTTTPGTCQPWVGQGGGCAVTAAQCGLGYECVTGSCVSGPSHGQDCAGTRCVQGYCDIFVTICKPYLADGASCETAMPWGCLSGTCNSVTRKCERNLCPP